MGNEQPAEASLFFTSRQTRGGRAADRDPAEETGVSCRLHSQQAWVTFTVRKDPCGCDGHGPESGLPGQQEACG